LRRLAAESELGDERTITLDILLLQILEQTTALADHLQQPSTGVEIVLVLAHVIRKMNYALRQYCYLHLWRTSVALVGAMLFYRNLFFLQNRQLLALLFLSIL